MKAFLNLSCHGHKMCGLTMCPGVSNRIADLRRIGEKEFIVDYLDTHCKIFDQRATDANKINNIVNYLAREGVVIAQVEKTVMDFFAMHRKCGFYMWIDPIQDEQGV
jgi:hypothetical protein